LVGGLTSITESWDQWNAAFDGNALYRHTSYTLTETENTYVIKAGSAKVESSSAHSYTLSADGGWSDRTTVQTFTYTDGGRSVDSHSTFNYHGGQLMPDPYLELTDKGLEVWSNFKSGAWDIHNIGNSNLDYKLCH
jgi:hypothetical protein